MNCTFVKNFEIQQNISINFLDHEHQIPWYLSQLKLIPFLYISDIYEMNIIQHTTIRIYN